VASIAAEASHLTENPRRHKIVYHLTEPGADKAKAVLGNIRNHVKGVGPDRVVAPELAAAEALIRSGAIVAAAQAVTGPLK